jgi:hypothetical protein
MVQRSQLGFQLAKSQLETVGRQMNMMTDGQTGPDTPEVRTIIFHAEILFHLCLHIFRALKMVKVAHHASLCSVRNCILF